MTKDAIVIAYVNRTGELLGCHTKCTSWGVKYSYAVKEYKHYIESDGYINYYVPCNLLHLNTPEALEKAHEDNQHWWQKFYKDIPKLKEALIKKGVIPF